MPRACLVARRDYSTLYPLFQLLPAASSLWRWFRIAVFEDIIRPAQNWGFLAPARSFRLNERKSMLIFFQHRRNTRKRNQGSNGAWEASAIKIRAPLLEVAGRSRYQRSHWGVEFWRRAFSRRFSLRSTKNDRRF